MILKQCDSPHIVRYFGTYIKDTDLWISMEYCNAGSVSDLMEAVGITLDEVCENFLQNFVLSISALLGLKQLQGSCWHHSRRGLHAISVALQAPSAARHRSRAAGPTDRACVQTKILFFNPDLARLDVYMSDVTLNIV